MGTTICIVFSILYLLILRTTTLFWIGWLVLAVSILISIPFCYLAVKYLIFASIVTAVASGTALAMVLHVAVIYMINVEFAIFITIGALCLVSIVLFLMFKDHAINVGNAILGSYLIMRGVGLILDYPYEFVIYYERMKYMT
jgi:hypothetical protein